MDVLRYLAQSKIDPNSIGLDPVKDADAALAGFLTVVYGAAAVVCVLVIIIAGFMYVTSAGDPTGIKRGKDAILGASIGLVVVLMAFVITQFVLGRF